jgi:hypothetical protein
MTTKIATRKPRKVSLEDWVTKEVEKLGYKISNLNYAPGDVELSLYEGYDESRYSLNFDANRQEFCCGVIEIGDIDSGFEYMSERERTALKPILLRLIAESIKRSVENEQGRLVMFTVPEKVKAYNLIVEAALSTGLFEQVRRFKNPGSGNWLRTYMTNP